MTTSPAWLIDLMETSDVLKALVASQAVQDTEDRFTKDQAILIDDSGTFTLTDAEVDRAMTITLNPDATPPSGAFTVRFPARDLGPYGIINNTAQDATIEIASQVPTAPTVPASTTDAALVWVQTAAVIAWTGIEPGNLALAGLTDIVLTGVAEGHILVRRGTNFAAEALQIGTGAIPILPSFTVAGLLSAATWDGGMIIVSDEVGGEIPAFSDGTDWRRVSDRAIVS